MKQLTRKLVSVFFSVVFLLASGTGQLIHAHFHDHNYKIKADANASALNTPHNYCSALQLTLPEFFKSGTCILKNIDVTTEVLFVDRQPAIPHVLSFKSSDRAPPFFSVII
jgi:hypothetical protein